MDLWVNPIEGRTPMRMTLSGLPLCKAGDWGLQTLNGVHLQVCAGTWFPHAPHSGGVYCFFDVVEKTIHPTPKLWHAVAFVLYRA